MWLREYLNFNTFDLLLSRMVKNELLNLSNSIFALLFFKSSKEQPQPSGHSKIWTREDFLLSMGLIVDVQAVQIKKIKDIFLYKVKFINIILFKIINHSYNFTKTNIAFFMKKNYISNLFVVLFSVFVLNSFAQSTPSFWNKTTKEKLSKEERVLRKSEPKKAQFYILDTDAFKNHLADAPQRISDEERPEKFVAFPTADDTFETFSIMEASIMEKPLQDKYQNIRTYVGKSTSNPTNTIRFSITPYGLHTMSFRTGHGTEFIDPYTKDSNAYIVYSKKDLTVLDEEWICEFENDTTDTQQRNMSNNNFSNANDGNMRDFRLALACTVEYAQFHWTAAGLTAGDTEASKKAAVLAAMVVTINRNNFIYERDLSLTMTIVANNENIIFIDSDNFSNTNSGALINESQFVIDNIIGFSNYDIGHTFSTGGGGLASLNSPCTGSKARGITGQGSPVGDPFDVDYVAHELGHQFGAPHTFNGSAGSCGSNISPSNAYEPGSGSTIMAYAGICTPQNVQSNSDAYFHQKSLQMMWDNISIGFSTCATQTPTGNTAPTADAGNDYVIPALTPYKLTGTSTDIDGTASHTYTWEQYDLGDQGAPAETNTNGPLVRSFEGTNSPTRYIPRMSDILANGGVSTEWEKLSSVDRNLNFKVTVRDNDTRGGQTATSQMTATVVSAAGPFVVTSQNVGGQTWTVGATETITWDVAGTTANGINEANVDILFATDGLNYDTVLATGVPNDGSHEITVPNVASTTCRVMVAAANNIFFNINTQNITVGLEESCTSYADSNLGLTIPDGLGADTPGDFLVEPIEITEDVVISDVNFSIDIAHTYINDLQIILQHPDGTQAVLFNRNCGGDENLNILLDDEASSAIVCGSPTAGTFQSGGTPLSNFDGLSSAGTWLIGIRDFYIGDTGLLNDYSLEICATVPLNVQDEEFNALQVYPNPNNGSFSIGFNPKSGQDISVDVYDIRGRLMYANKYSSTTRFEEVITLNNAQSGVYLVQIADGPNRITKKIIVN